MKTINIFIFIILFASISASAQYVEDALRYSQPNGYITARAGGLNISYLGICDDYAAVYYNPAGLALVPKSEFTMGLGFTRNATETSFINNNDNFNSNNAYIDHIGFVVPFQTQYGNSAVAIGYMLESDFNNNLEYHGINAANSMIAYQAQMKGSISSNMASYLWLADDNFNTPINGNLDQHAFIKETGGLHCVTGGAGFAVSENVSIGFSLIGKWGTYTYARDYTEYDYTDKYNMRDSLGSYNFNGYHYTNINFNDFSLKERISQNISAIGGSVGVQARLGNILRFNAAVRFPTFYDIEENFSQDAYATFDGGIPLDNGVPLENHYINEGKTSYKVETPFIYSAGISLHAANLTFSAAVQYSDVTQIQFSDAPPEVLDLNTSIVRDLVGQTTWGFGVEYEVPLLPVVARASYASTTSPYVKDVAGASMDYFSVGGGFYVAPNIRLDGLFRWTSLSQLRTNYGNDISQYIFTAKPLNISFQLTYRY